MLPNGYLVDKEQNLTFRRRFDCTFPQKDSSGASRRRNGCSYGKLVHALAVGFAEGSLRGRSSTAGRDDESAGQVAHATAHALYVWGGLFWFWRFLLDDGQRFARLGQLVQSRQGISPTWGFSERLPRRCRRVTRRDRRHQVRAATPHMAASTSRRNRLTVTWHHTHSKHHTTIQLLDPAKESLQSSKMCIENWDTLISCR